MVAVNFPAAPAPLSHLERRTAQLASLAAITLLAAPPPDLYAVDVYLDCSLGGAAGTVIATVSYTDSSGATSQVTGALVLTGIGRLALRLSFFLASGDIAFTTTVAGAIGAPTYNVTARAERCWSTQ